MGCSSTPWLVPKKDESAFMSFWSKMILVPLPDYASRRVSSLRRGRPAAAALHCTMAGQPPQTWPAIRCCSNCVIVLLGISAWYQPMMIGVPQEKVLYSEYMSTVLMGAYCTSQTVLRTV